MDPKKIYCGVGIWAELRIVFRALVLEELSHPRYHISGITSQKNIIFTFAEGRPGTSRKQYGE